jgi:hypothetical protein
MGLLLGLHQFRRESACEFKDWASDARSFSEVVDAWKVRVSSRVDIFAVKSFMGGELDGDGSG